MKPPKRKLPQKTPRMCLSLGPLKSDSHVYAKPHRKRSRTQHGSSGYLRRGVQTPLGGLTEFFIVAKCTKHKIHPFCHVKRPSAEALSIPPAAAPPPPSSPAVLIFPTETLSPLGTDCHSLPQPRAHPLLCLCEPDSSGDLTCGVIRCCPFLFSFLLFRATPAACGGSQARGPIMGPIRATAAGLHPSHSNARSELHLQPTPQLMATPDP